MPASGRVRRPKETAPRRFHSHGVGQPRGPSILGVRKQRPNDRTSSQPLLSCPNMARISDNPDNEPHMLGGAMTQDYQRLFTYLSRAAISSREKVADRSKWAVRKLAASAS